MLTSAMFPKTLASCHEHDFVRNSIKPTHEGAPKAWSLEATMILQLSEEIETPAFSNAVYKFVFLNKGEAMWFPEKTVPPCGDQNPSRLFRSI